MNRIFALWLLVAALFVVSCKRTDSVTQNIDNQHITGRDTLAYLEHFPPLKVDLAGRGVDVDQLELHLRAYKHERDLQVWIRQRGDDKFQYYKSYDFCRYSGDLGPKRMEGDFQIPEGLYHIDRFNPLSDFHLSLGINYPNTSDLIRGDTLRPGSDIFIHGGCMTVGCIPITNAGIKELYTLADLARMNGQERIAVHIFPFKMTAANMRAFAQKYPKHQAFWKELQPFYEYFEKNKKIPEFDVEEDGAYRYD